MAFESTNESAVCDILLCMAGTVVTELVVCCQHSLRNESHCTHYMTLNVVIYCRGERKHYSLGFRRSNLSVFACCQLMEIGMISA